MLQICYQPTLQMVFVLVGVSLIRSIVVFLSQSNLSFTYDAKVHHKQLEQTYHSEMQLVRFLSNKEISFFSKDNIHRGIWTVPFTIQAKQHDKKMFGPYNK
jgi:hypothetical protein